MEDEESNEKTSRKDRWRGALQRTKTKLKEHSKKGDKDAFKLSDDVNEFLQAGRPSTSDSAAGRLETPPDKLFYPQTDHDRMVQAGMTSMPYTEQRNITPPRPLNTAQRSPRGIPIPRIDVSKSQRWPAQQDLHDLGAQEIDDFLGPAQRPEQHARSQSHGPVPGRRRGNRPRNLSVAFLEAPPVIIGEGGEQAEAPTIEIGRSKSRARSVSPMPARGIEGQPQNQRRKQVPGNPGSAGSGSTISPQQFEPQRLTRVQTGMILSPAASKSSADVEFEMTLQAPTSLTAVRAPSPQRSPEYEAPPTHPNRLPPSSAPAADKPGEVDGAHSTQTNYEHHHLRPAAAKEDLRMQFEEGQALRHSHYRGLSNTSIIRTDVSPVSPDLRHLSLDEDDKKHGVVEERRVSEVSPITPEDQSGRWV